MKDNTKHIVEKQTTKKGSKVDAVNLDGEELKAILEEKLGTEFTWSDYTWDATANVNGVDVYLKFVESDNGNSYEIGYHKDGSIHDRSVWKDNSKEAFEADSDALKAELDEYGAGDSGFASEDTSTEDDSAESEPTEDFEAEDDFESDDTPDESEEELDFDNFGESVKRANERARLAEEKERIAAKVKKESEIRGHFEDLSSYFENYFPNVDPHVVGNPVFTDNGTADLERKGLSGYSVWVGYQHKGNGAPSKIFEKKMKAFVYAEVIPAFEEFIAESGETFENPEVIVEDFTAATDMVRLYAVTSSNKAAVVAPEVHESFKKYEGDTINELFEKVGKKELVAKYLKEDKRAKDADCMIDECNQKRLFCFLKREKIEF